MTQFTQLGLSEKPEVKASPGSTQRDDQPRFIGTQVVAVFATALLATSLAGLFLLESGCSQEGNKNSNIQSPVAQTLPSSTGMGYATTSISPAPEVAAQPKKKAAKKPTTVAYNDSTSGVTFQYPKRYVLKTPDSTKPEDSDMEEFAMNFVQPGGVMVATVELPKGTYRGTDLASASFNVSMNKNLSAEQCSQFSLLEPDASGRPAILPSKVKLGGMEFQEFEAIEGPDTQQADARYYHTYQNGACYEFALGLETEVSDAAEEVTPVDRAAVFHRLQLLLNSVKITPQETPEVAVSVPDAPAQPAQQATTPTVTEADGAHQ